MVVVLALLGMLPQSGVVIPHHTLLTSSCSFENRDDCEEVVRTFNNFTIKSGGEDLQIQIRYADTKEQKMLKQQTQAARQFRSAEYEFATQAWRQGRLPYAGSTVHDTPNANEFEEFLGTSANVPIQGQRWAQSAIRQVPVRSPLGSLPFTGATQQPQVNVTSGAADAQSALTTDGAADLKPVTPAPATALANNSVDSAASASEQIE